MYLLLAFVLFSSCSDSNSSHTTQPDCRTDEDCVGRGDGMGEPNDFHDPSKVQCRSIIPGGTVACSECIHDSECPDGFYCLTHAFCVRPYNPDVGVSDGPDVGVSDGGSASDGT